MLEDPEGAWGEGMHAVLHALRGPFSGFTTHDEDHASENHPRNEKKPSLGVVI